MSLVLSDVLYRKGSTRGREQRAMEQCEGSHKTAQRFQECLQLAWIINRPGLGLPLFSHRES
jgi:hypothetical protein